MNRLADETSPYLLQHADNPVDWFPWGEEALARANPGLESPVVDLGCGTGLSGEALRAAGFADVDGYDFSEGMLALARKKNCYREIINTDLSQPGAT